MAAQQQQQRVLVYHFGSSSCLHALRLVAALLLVLPAHAQGLGACSPNHFSSSSSSPVPPGRSQPTDVVPGSPATLLAIDYFGIKALMGKPDDPLTFVCVSGPPYELGRAHGALLRNEVQTFYSRLFRYMEDVVLNALHLSALPDTLTRSIARLVVNIALDATRLVTLRHTPTHFVDEMLGLANGAGVSYQNVARINMIPELLKASCSMLGSWGFATCNTSSRGGLYQLRALDWNVGALILDFHAMIVYHPFDGFPFTLFTWAGFIGCVTGYSGQIGISEKAWMGYKGVSSRAGMPWHFVLRDVLQFTKSIHQAQSYLLNVPRTCPILVGIGSIVEQQFYLVGYSVDTLEFYDDNNYTLITSLFARPPTPGVVFVDKYIQPSNDDCMASLVSKLYGMLDEAALMEMVMLQRTGDTHVAIYDFFTNHIYFSWAVLNKTSMYITPAYERYFLKLNMSFLLSYFVETPSMIWSSDQKLPERSIKEL